MSKLKESFQLKAIIILIAFFSNGCFAEQSQYTIGIGNLDHYPYFSANRNSIARDVFDGFADSKGISFEYRPMTISQLHRALLVNDSVDFRFPDHPSWGLDYKQQQKIHYSRGVVEYVDGIITKSERNINSIGKVRVIGAVQGMTLVPYLEVIEENGINVLRTTNFRRLITALINDKVDGVYSNIHVMLGLINESNADVNVSFNYSLPYQRSSYRLSSKKYPDMLKEFDHYLKANSIRIEAIKRNYGITP